MSWRNDLRFTSKTGSKAITKTVLFHHAEWASRVIRYILYIHIKMTCIHHGELVHWNCWPVSSWRRRDENYCCLVIQISMRRRKTYLVTLEVYFFLKSRRHLGSMPTTHSPTVHASWWTSLNMSRGDPCTDRAVALYENSPVNRHTRLGINAIICAKFVCLWKCGKLEQVAKVRDSVRVSCDSLQNHMSGTVIFASRNKCLKLLSFPERNESKLG